MHMDYSAKYDVVIAGAGIAGVAAGLAAALCVEQRRTPHELPAATVQNVLRQQGTKLHLDEAGLQAKRKP